MISAAPLRVKPARRVTLVVSARFDSVPEGIRQADHWRELLKIPPPVPFGAAAKIFFGNFVI